MPTTTYSPGAGSLTLTGSSATWTRTFNPAAGAIVVTGSFPSFSQVQTVGVGTFAKIGATSLNWRVNTASIHKVLSAAWSASFELIHSSGDTIPQPGDSVSLFWQSVKRFGGLVQTVTESAIPGTPAGAGPSILTIQCTGYSAYLDRVIVARLYTLLNVVSGVLSIIVQDLTTRYFSQFGIYYVNEGSPASLVPTTLFHYITGSESLNRLRDMFAGWDWWVGDNLDLHFANMAPGTPSAPFTLRNGGVNMDEVAVLTNAVKFRNKQWVLPSQDLLATRTDTVTTTNNGQVFFETLYPQTQPPIVLVQYGGAGPFVQEAVTQGGTWTGAPWYWVDELSGVFRTPSASPMTTGDVIEVTYRNPFPLAMSAQDDASIAAKGLYEAVYQAKNVIDEDTAQAMAQGILDTYGTNGDFPQELRFTYNSKSQSAWLIPGMVLDVDITFPTALGNFTVEQVSSQEQDGAIWRHSVVARSGLGDVTTAVDEQQFLTSARVGISSPPVRAEWMLAETLPGITNPGLATGLVDNFIPIQVSGTIDSWSLQAILDPPTGDDLQVDILLSTDGGVSFSSIFPVGAANKAVLPDGQTSEATGITFVTENLRVNTGDILQPNVIQVGSTNPGTNIKLLLNIRSGQNV